MNTYNFDAEASGIIDPLWAIGSATVEGKISNLKFFPGNIATADIDYKFHDKFSDPYDTFNATKNEWNPNGAPYTLKDSWRTPVRFPYRPYTEERFLHLLKR
ncbi:hypothetical protein A1D23_04655 [Chelonobacter oris]|nr:hypothetical protein [Chelonobacter oris]